MAQDFLLLAPVEVVWQVTSATLLVVEHFAANITDVDDFAISVDCDVGLVLLALLTDNTDVVIGLECAAYH